MTSEVPPYVQSKPLPNVDPNIQACFPESGLFHHAMWYLAETSYTSPYHHLAALIPAVANLMAQRGFHTAGRGQQTAVQTLIVGPSGSGKSVALREVRRLAEEAEQLYRGAQYAPEVHNRWVHAEGTTAGLLEHLHDLHVDTWPGQIPGTYWPLEGTPVVLYHEEFSSVLSKRDSLLETVLQLFDPQPKMERNLAMYRAMTRRGEQAPNVVERPAVSAVVCTTPAALQSVFTTAHMEGGLAQRFVWAYAIGERDRLRVDAPTLSSERTEVARDWAGALRWWDQWLLANGGPHRAPRVVHLDLHVKRRLDKQLETVKEAHERHDFAAVSTRLRGLNATQALAQIYAWSRGDLVVHVDDLDRAARFYQLSYESIEKLSDMLDRSLGWQRQAKLLEVIEARGKRGMSKSEMYKVLRCSKPELDLILDSLRDREAIQKVTVSPAAAKRRGRPIERWAAMDAKSHLRLVKDEVEEASDDRMAQDESAGVTE